MKRFFEIFKYVKNYKMNVFFNLLFNVVSILFSLFSFASVIPFLKILFSEQGNALPEKPQTDEFSLSSDQFLSQLDYRISLYIAENGTDHSLMLFCLLIVAMFFFRNISQYLAMFHLAPIRNGVVRDLRIHIYHQILALPLSYYSEEKKGDLIAKITQDVAEVEWSVIGLLELMFKNPLTFLFYLGTLFYMSWELTLFVLILLPVSGFLISRIGKSLKRAAERGQKKLGEVLSFIEETLTGLKIIKAFNAEGIAKTRFKENIDVHFRLMVRLFRRQYLASPLSEFMGAIVMATMLWFGGRIVLQSDTLTGEYFITYIIIFSQLISPAKSFSEAFFRIQKGIASVDRINEILDAEITIKDAQHPMAVSKFQEKIAFSNVSFKYETEHVLRNIDLEVEKGKTIALVGASGSGKSTLVDLLARFYDPQEGEIRIDGIPIQNFRIRDLRNLMGIVSQDAVLFNNSVLNNILFGHPTASAREVIQAAKIANAHEFIMQLDQGYRTNIGDLGNKLSGGQKQRLSIARAVLKNPPILILDEATSALDTGSEKLVQDALQKLMVNRTSIIIAHRLTTIHNADLIAVMEKGQIIERGTHEELIQNKGKYKSLYELQAFG